MLNDMPPNYAKARNDNPRRKLASRALPAANVIVFECPIDRPTRVDAIIVCNVAATQVNFRLYHTAPAESVGQANALFYDMIVRPNSSVLLEMPLYMNSGDRVTAYASAASSLGISLYGGDM